MFHSLPSNPEGLLATFIDRLCPVRTDAPDFASRRRRALIRIAYYLQEYNVTLYEVGFDVPRDFSIAEHIEDLQRQDDEEEQQMLTVLENGVPRRRTWQEVAKTERAKLNHDQTAVFERIADAIDNPLNADGSRKQTLFFVTGQGGTGKTFLFNSLISHIRSSNKTYLGTASTGIAALLLRGGRTAHSTFRIANDLTEENTPTINFESRYAEAIRNASMILIDEVSMMNKTVLHYIEKVIKSVHLEPELRDLPFAGKVIILSGDFKQLTPVVVGAGKAGEISASIRKSDLFKKFEHLRLTQNMRLDKNQASFAKWLDELGNGTNIIPNSDGCVQVPEETSVNNLNSLIDFCYPNNCLSDPVNRIDDIKGSSILCTTNNTTFKVNETLLDRLPGKARTFKSIDKPMSDPHKLAVAMALDVHAQDYTTEAINSKTPSGLPPHELKLKVGAVVMLIRNLSLRDGLCNGTMLQILEFHGELLRCVNITEGTHQNKEVFIPRTKLVFGTGQYDRCEKFSRIQFPVRLAFAITINKSQGQTLQRVGLYFSGDQCFAHGQLYVAFSRVRHLGAIRILNLVARISDFFATLSTRSYFCTEFSRRVNFY
ncbi:hypothetical protein L596_010806 [Steinernema carpocapsae]|nr:hypothetical protein L596_010806 [Steinernema carpocapsae]